MRVLPEPLSPAIPTISPCPMENEIPSTARRIPRDVRSATVRFSTSSNGDELMGRSLMGRSLMGRSLIGPSLAGGSLICGSSGPSGGRACPAARPRGN